MHILILKKKATIQIWNSLRDTAGRKQVMMDHLVPLVWFGHSALWDHLHSVHFVVGEVCHLIAPSEATLGGEGEDKQNDQLTKNKKTQQVENLQ